MITNKRSIVFVFCGILLAAAPVRVAVAGEDGKAPVLTVLERTTEPLLKADRPWEEVSIGMDQVLRIGDQWHLWYVAFDRDCRDGDCYLCYARSKDGIRWEKPALGIYSYKGNKDNNILMFDFNLCTIIFDENAPAAERFKGVGARMVKPQREWWIFGATSPDGLRWKMLDEPLLKKNSDTGNICIHDGDVYRLYVRMWSGWSDRPYTGKRVVGYTESATFGDFPDPVVILKPDKDDPSDFHLYNSATTKIKDDLYLMFPSGYFAKSGTSLVYAAFSRDGKQFRRLGRKPLLGLGKGFDSKGIYVATGATPGEKPGTYWFYYGGTTVHHDEDESMPSKVPGTEPYGIGRFLLRIED